MVTFDPHVLILPHPRIDRGRTLALPSTRFHSNTQPRTHAQVSQPHDAPYHKLCCPATSLPLTRAGGFVNPHLPAPCSARCEHPPPRARCPCTALSERSPLSFQRDARRTAVRCVRSSIDVRDTMLHDRIGFPHAQAVQRCTAVRVRHLSAAGWYIAASCDVVALPGFALALPLVLTMPRCVSQLGFGFRVLFILLSSVYCRAPS